MFISTENKHTTLSGFISDTRQTAGDILAGTGFGDVPPSVMISHRFRFSASWCSFLNRLPTRSTIRNWDHHFPAQAKSVDGEAESSRTSQDVPSVKLLFLCDRAAGPHPRNSPNLSYLTELHQETFCTGAFHCSLA